MNLNALICGLSTLVWLLFFYLLAYAVLRAGRGQSTKGMLTPAVIVLVVALVLSVLSQSIVFIEPTERGVVISALEDGDGIRPIPMMPGLNFKIPMLETVVTYPVSRQTYTMSIAHEEGDREGDDSVEARTSDGQVVKVDATEIFMIDPNRVIDVHIAWENTYRDGLIRTLTRGVIRSKVAQFTNEEVYSSKRQELTDQIRVELTEKLAQEGFILVEFVIHNIAVSDK